ncbi:hypothetical protein BCR33DRAFT_316318 [Rhizoclosmatium globosum]|uniref:Protein kinase domain-containing protein n=1 Tax=Rhizoclosmatium globosum TaxID=329046 RepID=A0A1Y2CZ88_9FUNG|nr:hypothetical protein BCR33DRAFT_316318 [Rhizoclosmatium globosum]|eukprot:ORY52372.1 hypothetical protein BCR33DRAFT_316318 [Rhizoclosmatium globosum]
MLYGHLPFPDDPNNPGGLDIGLLYEYVRSTAIIYPESVSDDARDLMNAMLQVRRKNRANISTIMSHSWLSPAVDIFEDELNRKMDLLNIAGDDAIFTDSRGIERISSKHDSSEPSSPTIYQPKPRRLPNGQTVRLLAML